MSLYITLPRIDSDMTSDDKWKWEIYFNAVGIFETIDLYDWDEAYPTLGEQANAMDNDDWKDFNHHYQTNVIEHVEPIANRVFDESNLWHKRVNEFNYHQYNEAVRDISWELLDCIVDELKKYLGLEMDREVMHGEAA